MILNSPFMFGLPWSPIELPNLLSWFDASDSASISNPSAVTQWNDKSANANHLISTKALKPDATSQTLNGLAVMNFAGEETRYLQLNTRRTNVRSVFMLAKWADTAGDFRTILGDLGQTGGDGSQGAEWAGGFSPNLFSEYTGLAIYNGTRYINGVSTGGHLSRYTNWTQHGFLTTANVPVSVVSADRPVLGASAGWGTRAFKGQVAEIVLMSTVATDTDRIKLQNYWASKYAL